MRGALVAGIMALLLAVAGCDDDSSSSDSGGGGSTGGAVADASGPDPGCSNQYPRQAPPPDSYRGFAEMCAAAYGHSVRIQNVSSGVVLELRSDRPALKHAEISPPPESLSAAAVQYVAAAACDLNACTVPPGASVRMTATGPFWVTFAVADGRTVAAALSTVLMDYLQSYLPEPGPAGARRVAACGEGVAATLTSHYWEEAFRHAVGSSVACRGMVDELSQLSGETRTSTLRTLLSRARSLSGGTWQDALLLAAKTLNAAR